MKTVSVAQAATAQEAVLPARVQEALGELVGAAKDGLLALSVGVGLGVLAELMEEEVDGPVGGIDRERRRRDRAPQRSRRSRPGCRPGTITPGPSSRSSTTIGTSSFMHGVDAGLIPTRRTVN